MDYNIEAIYKHFVDEFSTEAATIVGAPVEIRFRGNNYDTQPSRDKYWVRLSPVVIRSEQATLSVSSKEFGKKRYKTRGVIFAQIFGPREKFGSYDKCGELATLARKVLRKNPTDPNSTVWFKEATAEGLDPEDNWQRWDTSASFTFESFE